MSRKKEKDANAGVIMICAVRYALGRQTYMPGLVQDYIMAHKEDLTPENVEVMIRDISEADKITEHKLSDGEVMKIDGLGDTRIDRPGWIRFREWLECLLREMQR